MAPTAKTDDRSSSRKRKPSASSSITSTTSSVPAKKSATAPTKTTPTKKPAPTIADYGKLEERQAQDRSAEKDTVMFKSTCDKMKDLLTKIHEAKNTASTSGGRKSESMTDLKNEFLMHFLSLKKLNRLDKLRTKNTRDLTIEAKSKVDNFHLQLQNLLYEVLHLQKEVTKCLQYRSSDEEMELVSLKEFYAEAPEDVAKKDTTKDNEHLQRLARLEYENIQRQKQSEDFKKLETEKHSLESHIRKKKDNLANLKPQLGAILDASKPVQKYLDMPLDQERDQLDLAKYLPAPLFILFSETRAFAKACDSKLESTIQGDLEEAKAEFATNLRRRMATTGDSSVNDEDEEEIKDDDEEDDSKKKKAKMASTKASKSEKLKKLTICHPLKVEVRITLKDGQNCVQLSFAHLTQLEVITVNVKLVLDQECKSFTGDREVLQAGNLLANLLTSPDEGSNCPNPASLYILKKSGLEPSSRLFSDIGSMYQWAQNLAGLKFPELTSEENFNAINAEAGICRPLVEATILAIRERLTSRIYLQKEISLLEKSKLLSVELPIPDGLKNAFPDKISSSIRAWASVGWEQYVALDVTKHLVETGAVTEHDFLFRLQINRDSAASLIALIAVKPDHPNSPPVFCLNLHWNGEYNIHNSENIRALEKEVNTGFSHLLSESDNAGDKYGMLGLQIKKLMCCYDVLLEAWQQQGSEAKVDFQREKMFLHSVRGRRREPPLHYDPSLQIFTQ